MVVSPTEFIVVALASVVLSLALLAAVWPWTRRLRTLLTIAVAMAAGELPAPSPYSAHINSAKCA